MGKLLITSERFYYMIIHAGFNLLFLLIPLIFYPRTSELFEFNKIITLYIITATIGVAWAIRSILAKKFIFQRTLLDIPLVFFLISQILSTIFSIDQRTSLLGYYSRFNGGLASTVCYLILYWSYTANIKKSECLLHLKTVFITTALVSVYGILEHFGRSPSCLLITRNFNADCWVQEVQLRVFASFGQPNWMAAWLIAIIPLLFGFALSYKSFSQKIYIVLTALFFWALLYTKSRSGILGIVIALVIFALGNLYKNYLKKENIKLIVILYGTIIAGVLLVGTPWNPSLKDFLNPKTVSPSAISGPVLETGGTESGDIRKIVWKGAIEVWKHYPIFGTGVETFAFSYYEFRPLAHNLTSEWNFLYNKAHNEYLNYLATTGIVGFISYLFVLIASIFLFVRSFIKSKNYLQLGLLSGYLAILISNFFGFSVVPTSLLTFMFPAISIVIFYESKELTPTTIKQSTLQSAAIGLILISFLYVIWGIAKYWYSDYLYASASKYYAISEYEQAKALLDKSIELSPGEALYLDELAQTKLALGDIAGAVKELNTASRLSPRNIKLLKSKANTLLDIGDIDESMYSEVINISEYIRALAPTDPSIPYTMGLTYAKMGRIKEAIVLLEEAIKMKPNYKNARVLISIIYEQEKDYEKAKTHLTYILEKIAPDDEKAKTDLQRIENAMKSK